MQGTTRSQFRRRVPVCAGPRLPRLKGVRNDSGTHQTKNHLFKRCDKWKDLQATLWAEAKRETGRGKQRLRVGDLLAGQPSCP